MRRWLVQGFLLANAVVMLAPLVLMAVSAFKTNAELFASPFAGPEHWSFGNLRQVWDQTSFVRYLANSLLVTAAAVAVILFCGTLAAYALARYRFLGAGTLLALFVAGLLVPLKLAVIPLFVELDRLRLLDSRTGLVLVYAAMGLPSAVFILTGFLRALPGELEQAARIDGASELRIMLTVMLPLARPAMAIAAIQNAVPIWNDFFFPLVFITSDARKTLPQGLTVFMGEYNTDWGVLFTGLTLASTPIVLLYLALSRQFIAGLTEGVGR